MGSQDQRQRWVVWTQMDAHRVTLGMTRDDLRRVYLHLRLARLTDERITALREREVCPPGPSSWGHEAAQVGCANALLVGQDYLLPYYRDLGLMLAIGLSPLDILLNQLGRATDPISGGRMRPAQWNSKALRVISASGLMATQTLHAAGIAFAIQISQRPEIAMTFSGEGATSEGDFHEALNFASIHRLGVVFVCENNGIALSTPQARQMAVPYVADRAAAYGMTGIVVDGTNVLAVISAARDAVARARGGGGPTLLEIIIPRRPALVSVDDHSAELADPVALFGAYLLERGDLTPELDRRLARQIASELDEAERDALAAPAPDLASAEAPTLASPHALDDVMRGEA